MPPVFQVEYPAIIALIWAHERTDLTDHEAINELSSAQRRSESRATPEALLLAATFKWLTNEHVEARRIVQLVIEREDLNDESRVAATATAIRALTLRGWIDLTCVTSSASSNTNDSAEARDFASRSIRYFDRALGDRSNSKRDLEAMMGRAKYYENTGKFTESLESLNQAIVLYQWFHPALSEKAKVLVRMGDWDQAFDTAERVIQRDRQDIEALRIMLLHALLRSSSASNGEGEHGTSTQRVVKLIDRLTESLERHEPMNADLYFQCSRPLARLASRRPEILKLTLALVKRAQKLQPAESTYVTEFAYQSMLMGRLQRANDMYKQAASLDDANVDAVTGMIRCQLEGGQLVDAEQQIEFMREIQQSIGESPELTLLTALLAWRKDGNRNKAVTLLDSTLETFWRLQPNASSATGTSWNLENIHARFVSCNLDFLLQISREYLQHSGTEPLGASEQSPPHLTKGESTLCTVVSLAPGFIEAQFLLAKARYLGRKFEAAERTLTDCLRLDPTFSKAHVLMAQLHLKQDRPNDASKSLEQAKALDFEIRENPQFHLIQGNVADASGDTAGAIKILEGALQLPAMQVAAKGRSGDRKKSSSGASTVGGVTPGDRATLYICLTELYAKSDQLKMAMSLVKKAMQMFRGTPEEVRVLISSSELAVQSGQTKRGLALLQSVRSNSPAYSKAQETMANVYLTKLHDKRKFIQCYEKLLSQNSKSPASHVMLGDAWMRIQEPEKAIAAYEDALAQNPNDAGLPLIIGRALVKTHDYHRAIQYYEDAVRRTRPSSRALAGLQLDLAELYRKLKKYDQAGRVMEDALEERRRRTNSATESKQGGRDREQPFDLERSKDDVKCMLLVSRIRKDNNDQDGAVESLLEAKEIQADIVQRVRGNMDENRSQRHQAAEICYDLASHYSNNGSGEKALVTYQAALRHEESHEKSLIALAKAHLRNGELDKCRQYCMTLTRIDSNNEEATMMLADMMFQKREFQPAIFHFQQLLQQRPDNFKGLYKLLQLLRRAGKIQEAKPFLEAAVKHSPQTKHRPGYQFCKGMFARYTNEVADAIRSLNQARKSAEWGEEAILNMVEVYLNPDNENIWEGMDGDGAGNANEGNMEAVRICERLLREIKKRPKSLRHDMLECHALIGTRQRPNIELALKRFHSTLKENPECVPALRGMSMALLMLKQTPKARNCLRRIHKMKYDPTFSEDFEVSAMVGVVGAMYLGPLTMFLVVFFLLKGGLVDVGQHVHWNR